MLLVKVGALLEELLETLDILEDEETIEVLTGAEEDVKAGRLRSYDDFINELKESNEI